MAQQRLSIDDLTAEGVQIPDDELASIVGGMRKEQPTVDCTADGGCNADSE